MHTHFRQGLYIVDDVSLTYEWYRFDYSLVENMLETPYVVSIIYVPGGVGYHSLVFNYSFARNQSTRLFEIGIIQDP